MKLSAKKRGQIYDLVHTKIIDLRIRLRTGLLANNPNKEKIDYYIAQFEIPLAQALMGLLDKDYKRGVL